MKFTSQIIRVALGFFTWNVEVYEKISKNFITFHQRPMFAKDVATEPLKGFDYSNCAILLQGPLVKKYDFTLETVRLYKKFFPKALIIISTWNDDPAYAARIRREAELIQSNKPAFNGPCNINLQIASTSAGIVLAYEKKVTYILKTRTDQRMYNPLMLASLIDLSNMFPVETTDQKKRLIELSCGNMRDYYRLADMFLFGEISDMFKYWSAEQIIHGSADEKNFRAAETYLFQKYLTKIGYDPILTEHLSPESYGTHHLECTFRRRNDGCRGEHIRIAEKNTREAGDDRL